MTIARYYDENKNPEGGMLIGVPLRDLTEEEYDAMPKWVQRSIDASPMYRKTKPGKPKAKPDAAEPEIVFTPDE